MATYELGPKFLAIKSAALEILEDEAVQAGLGRRATAIASVLHSAYVVTPDSDGAVYVPENHLSDNGIGVLFRSSLSEDSATNVGPYFADIPFGQAKRIVESSGAMNGKEQSQATKISALFGKKVLPPSNPNMLASYETARVTQYPLSKHPRVIQARGLVAFDDTKADKPTVMEAARAMIHEGDHEVHTRQTIETNPLDYRSLPKPVIATWMERGGYGSQYVAQTATADISSLPTAEELSGYDYTDVESAIGYASLPPKMKRLVRPAIAVGMSQRYGNRDMTALPTEQEVRAYRHLGFVPGSKR